MPESRHAVQRPTLSRVRFVVLSAFALVAFAGVAACASSGGGSGGPRTDRDLISSEELRALPPMNALQAVRRLRGRWLQQRNAGAPSVHVDGRFTGQLGVLEQYEISEVQELRFRPAREATTLYGTNYPAGVIEITTRRG